jgi:hypothetical protein
MDFGGMNGYTYRVIESGRIQVREEYQRAESNFAGTD